MDNPDPTYTKSNSIAKKKEAYKDRAAKTSAVGLFSADREQIGGRGKAEREGTPLHPEDARPSRIPANVSDEHDENSAVSGDGGVEGSTQSAVQAEHLAQQASNPFRGIPAINSERGRPSSTDLSLDFEFQGGTEESRPGPGAPLLSGPAAGARMKDAFDERATTSSRSEEALQRQTGALERTHVERFLNMKSLAMLKASREQELRKRGYDDEDIEEEERKVRRQKGRSAVSMSVKELVDLEDEREAFKMGRALYDHTFGCDEEVTADYLRLLVAAHQRTALTKHMAYDLAVVHARRRGKSGHGRVNNLHHADLYDDLAAELFEGD